MNKGDHVEISRLLCHPLAGRRGRVVETGYVLVSLDDGGREWVREDHLERVEHRYRMSVVKVHQDGSTHRETRIVTAVSEAAARAQYRDTDYHVYRVACLGEVEPAQRPKPTSMPIDGDAVYGNRGPGAYQGD